ncbi:SDR family oxidoreductase [Sphingomonas immobilis]|uniref:SDR family oxidoreductase n=1 Tax=Sphingomonas immobilis TaxID=3063997 RepID=A0ABT8ZXJ6_9SPHN|nr:SDR family oxidoreductase [Sphingomonas sp. CA1-15]MDO7842292.1 SDR family oxidoreductase [Sphingomonas sp. CA1-15]
MATIGSSERPDLPLAAVIGSGGLGLVTARRLAQTHRVVIASRNAVAIEERAAALRDEGLDVTGVACDITDGESVAALAAMLRARGPLRACAHVAALSPSMGDWRTLMHTNLTGTARIEQAMFALAGAGTAAVFVGSLASHTLTPAEAIVSLLDDPLGDGTIERIERLMPETSSLLAYQLSKFALKRMCERRAAAWGTRGARIVSISPGLVATPMGALEFRNQPVKHDLLAATPLAREATMPEIVDAIEFLASGRASFITGVDLLVDGGVMAAMRHRGS